MKEAGKILGTATITALVVVGVLGDGQPDVRPADRVVPVEKIAEKAALDTYVADVMQEECDVKVTIGQSTSTDVLLESSGSPECDSKLPVQVPRDVVERDYGNILTDEDALK